MARRSGKDQTAVPPGLASVDARHICERLDADRLIEMCDDVIPEPPEQVFAQHAAPSRWHRALWLATNPSAKLLAASFQERASLRVRSRKQR